MRDAQSGRDAFRRPLCAVFVSGTGTDVGKTVVTAALLRALRLAGVAAQAVKPVQTGVRAGEEYAASQADAPVYAAAVADLPPLPGLAPAASRRWCGPLTLRRWQAPRGRIPCQAAPAPAV